MARALSNTTLITALSESISLMITRRGYSAAAVTGTGKRGRSTEDKMKKKREGALDSVSNSWVPDPVTGYYRPGNRRGEIDAAELRELHLSHKSGDH